MCEVRNRWDQLGRRKEKKFPDRDKGQVEKRAQKALEAEKKKASLATTKHRRRSWKENVARKESCLACH